MGLAQMGWSFFLIWAGFNLLNAGIVWMFYPETGGLVLEAVDHVFTEDADVDSLGEGQVTGLQRLQWVRVRVAARAVKEARAKAAARKVDADDDGGGSGDEDESRRALLGGHDDAGYEAITRS